MLSTNTNIVHFHAVSCYSLFPLLFEAQEYPIKVVLLLLYAVLMFLGFSYRFPGTSTTTASKTGKGTNNNKSETRGFHIGWFGKSYLFGLLVIEIWGQFLHPIVFGDRFPFLPLMMISIYCALGMMYSWFWQLRQITLTQ